MMQKLKTVILLVAVFFFATSCHDYFDSTSPEVDIEQSKKGPGEGDDDSDRPDWAGGNTGANDHNNKPTPGTMGGSKDYGDLVVLSRDVDGVPEMLLYDELDEEGNPTGETFYVYQPINANTGLPVELDMYGEVPEGTELIEVDFGRLNIVRSPVTVLAQALDEVIGVIDEGDEYRQDFCGRLSIWKNGALLKTIDSPRESMAIYKEIMNNGFGDQLSALGSSGINALKLAASSFAAGSDKTGTVDIDEVEYINGMMKCYGSLPLTDEVGKEYYDFGSFGHDRGFFGGKMIQFLVWDGQYYPIDEYGNSAGPVFSVREVFEGPNFQWLGIGPRPEFTNMYSSMSNVAGFATAVDDAVQVLDFVHGDSNIRFLPDYPLGYKSPVP